MIRKLKHDDKELYLRLTSAFYASDAVLHPIPETHFNHTFDELMRSEDYAMCFILEHNGKPAGYALLSRTWSQPAGGTVLWLEEFYISPKYRRKGLGTEFLRYLDEHLPAARYRLEIEPTNRRAKALYTRSGYRCLPYQQMIKGT